MHTAFYFYFQSTRILLQYIYLHNTLQYDVHKIKMCGLTATEYKYNLYIMCMCFIRLVKSRNAIARTKELVVVIIGTHVYMYNII